MAPSGPLFVLLSSLTVSSGFVASLSPPRHLSTQLPAFSASAGKKRSYSPYAKRSVIVTDSLATSNQLTAKSVLLDIIDNGSAGDKNILFIDPVDGGELVLKTSVYGLVMRQCYAPKEVGKAYTYGVGQFVDLVAEEKGKPFNQMSTRELIGQNFFQTPLISAIYERGYRQNFKTAGFPGVDKEFDEANAYFQMGSTIGSDTTLLDLSCGSGFMTRKFIKCENYKHILSCDLSPTMLGETRQRIRREGLAMPQLFRADSARLPLKTESVDFIHCGAAFHCYPNLADSLAEIYRSLKVGGRLFASTFFVNAFTGRNSSSSGFYFFQDEEELVGLLVAAGFSRSNIQVRREGRACAIIKAEK